MTSTRKPRGRALGLPFDGTPGPHNAITDVPGVKVGFTTLTADAPRQIRTGVTAIIPRSAPGDITPVWAGFYALNGNGEMTGVHWVNDAVYFSGPICITNTHSVGIVHHAATRWLIRHYAKEYPGHHLWAMPIVAETYDGMINDINGQHVTEAHALAALDGAVDGPVAEGNVGGGTGMIAYEFKGGTGTSSRQVTIGRHSGIVAALVQANHGQRPWLSVLGVPVGKHLTTGRLREGQAEQGSIIVIIGTDLALHPMQLRRLAKRAAIGIGRGGTVGGNGSGDIFLAFSTANPVPLPQKRANDWSLTAINDELLDPVFEATVESIEEAVINAMLAAESVPTFNPPGQMVHAIDHDALIAVMRRHARLR